MARGISTGLVWSMTGLTCLAVWLLAMASTEIRATSTGPHTLLSIQKIRKGNFPQPPAPYSPPANWTEHQFPEAVAYFLKPINEPLPTNGTPYASSLRAYIVPDRGLPVPVPITGVGKKLIAVQFPTEWPKSVHELHLLLRGKQGESRYQLTGWRNTGPTRDQSLRMPTSAPLNWVRAWRADRTGFVDQRPSLTVSLSPRMIQSGTSYRIKNFSIITENGYIASGGWISSGIVNSPLTMASAWYDADVRQTICARFALEGFQVVQTERIKAFLIRQTRSAWIYQINSRRLGKIRWTVNKLDAFGFHQGKLETDRTVGVDHSELEIPELGGCRTWIDPTTNGDLPVRTGQRMIQKVSGSLTVYRRVSQTDYFANVNVTESRKPNYGMPFENSLATCSVCYDP